MQKIYLLLLCGALLLCGCDKQAKINSQKIDILSRKIAQLEQVQSQHMALLQTQLISLAPELDKMNSSYYERNRDNALFFHTNILYLLLTIGKQIESQLQAADAERAAQTTREFGYHTNQMAATALSTAQIKDAMADQESRMEQNINIETRKICEAISDVLLKQIKLSATPDAPEIARRKALMDEVAQIQRDLEVIKARLAMTNQPSTR